MPNIFPFDADTDHLRHTITLKSDRGGPEPSITLDVVGGMATFYLYFPVATTTMTQCRILALATHLCKEFNWDARVTLPQELDRPSLSEFLTEYEGYTRAPNTQWTLVKLTSQN